MFGCHLSFLKAIGCFFLQQVRRNAHAHAGVSWKCQRADFSWARATDNTDTGDIEDDDDDDESSSGPGLDVTDHVTANFTGLVHSLHAWY